MAQIQAIKETIKNIESIRRWFEKQTTYHFYSSSVFVVYESNLEDILIKNPSFNTASRVRTKLIDFAHVFPASNTRDENYLYGLDKLIEHLKHLLKKEYVFKDARTITF